MRINRVYTKVGDDGKTALIGGDRVKKSSPRIECYGTVDELNAALGMVRSALAGDPAEKSLLSIVARIQNELFNLGCSLATPDPERRAQMPIIAERHVVAIEADIDALNEGLPELKSFVLPGGGMVSSYFHMARTICRRAERIVVLLAETEDVDEVAIRYLNRLSDACFVFGRYAVSVSGLDEPLWEPEKA